MGIVSGLTDGGGGGGEFIIHFWVEKFMVSRQTTRYFVTCFHNTHTTAYFDKVIGTRGAGCGWGVGRWQVSCPQTPMITVNIFVVIPVCNWLTHPPPPPPPPHVHTLHTFFVFFSNPIGLACCLFHFLLVCSFVFNYFVSLA